MVLMTLLMVLVAAFVGSALISCSSDDEDIDDALVSEVANTGPEFTDKDFEGIPQDYEETTNGTWKVTKVNGIVCQIIFCTEGVDPAPSPASPKTTEDFFSEFLPLTVDNQMVFCERDYRNDPHYLQYYKGVPVEQGYWHFYFYEDGTMQGAYGYFLPIGELDVKPAFNITSAKRIVENYIHDSVDGEGKRIYLSIMSFPENGELKPRLVYVYKRQVWEEGEFLYIDAKTGRLLYKVGYKGGVPGLGRVTFRIKEPYVAPCLALYYLAPDLGQAIPKSEYYALNLGSAIPRSE